MDSDGLKAVTEAYEQAVFAPHGVPSETADNAVDASDDVADTRSSVSRSDD
ncbi:hypothetical protein BN903_170 [Halorubrum sp. AJ67]|nr:hypothetical protein BN903_170 [Halorubrum sp. AJ67]